MKKENDKCLSCGCYDHDYEGCTMPEYDKWYACNVYDNSTELAEILYSIGSDIDSQDYKDTEEETIKKLANDIHVAKEIGLDTLVAALEHICICEVFHKA